MPFGSPLRAQALEAERSQTKPAVAADGAAAALAGDELRAQADATQAASLEALAALATTEAVASLQERQMALLAVEALLHSHSAAVSTAAHKALTALWSAAVEPLSKCLECCYNSATAVAANAHFI